MCVVIKFVDGFESVLTENEFLNVMQRRRQDPFWKEVGHIKNYVETEANHCATLIAKYNR
jgi:hypothetical protein